MATYTATRAADGFQSAGGEFRVAWGTYDLAANPTAADIFELCRIPAGSTVVGGYFAAEDLDTGTEELDIDLGWAANGSEAADPDGLGNFGTLTGDAVTGYKPGVGTILPLQGALLSDGPLTFTKDTTIQAVVNTDAATFAAGRITAVVYYHTA